MGARPIWKGVIRCGNITVPVKFYSAVEDRSVHFRLLHKRDLTPVEQRMIHPRTDKPVPRDQVRRGYMTDEGEVVMFSDEELEALVPEGSRDIDITRFVDSGRINHQWYDRPYLLGPDGDAAAYFSLARALERGRKEGVARWTMRKKAYIGALGAESGYLKIITLRHAEEVVDASELPQPKSRDLEPQELRMAEQLVAALEGDFDPAAYADEHRRKVMALIEAKFRGGTIPFEKPKKRRPEAASLTEILEKSLSRISREKKRA